MMMERRLAAMEGAEACIATSSGMSAILLMCLGLLKAGDHVICSQSVFGSTIKLLAAEFGRSASRPASCRRPTWARGARRCGPPRGCCSPRRRATR